MSVPEKSGTKVTTGSTVLTEWSIGTLRGVILPNYCSPLTDIIQYIFWSSAGHITTAKGFIFLKTDDIFSVEYGK